MGALEGKRIVLGVTGGIAAYKAAELCRLLRKEKAQVRVVMTAAACEFVTPLTFQTLSGAPVARDLFDAAEEAEVGHIRLADETDLIVIAPATADFIARMAAGMADDLLTAVMLATRAPVLLAPAMNVNMWQNPLTQATLARLQALGRVTIVGPDTGDLACGWVGAGRLVNPQDIVASCERVLGTRELENCRVVITAGPTFEAVDDVRFLGNRSSGKMGFALAQVAARRGARVTLIAGPVSLPTPSGVAVRIDVESAAEMREVLHANAATADVVVMAAAVADFRPAVRHVGKLSRRAGAATQSLALAANPDLLAELGRDRGTSKRPFIVGFAAEVGTQADTLVDRARKKLKEKRCDVVVANDVGVRGIGFGSNENAVTLVFANGEVASFPPAPKVDIAESIWSRLSPLLTTLSQPPVARPSRTRAARTATRLRRQS